MRAGLIAVAAVILVPTILGKMAGFFLDAMSGPPSGYAWLALGCLLIAAFWPERKERS